jgi:putative tryptophan/tyrosine transport system substrate-binding protein
MNKKILVSIFAVVILAFMHPAEAQQPKKVLRIEFLSFVGRSNSPAPNIEAFRQGLRDLVYVEGQNIVIEYRNAEGKENRLPDVAAGLIRLKVDIILAQSTTGLLINYQSTGRPDVCNS